MQAAMISRMKMTRCRQGVKSLKLNRDWQPSAKAIGTISMKTTDVDIHIAAIGRSHTDS